MIADLSRNWWVLMLRGAGILFGIMAVIWVCATLALLVYVFGAFVSSMASLP
jgi:uncharacterized membrane protein HdeD (DUF308 family)